jgi:hypothetical protein
MAHFAKLTKAGNIVLKVEVVHNSILNDGTPNENEEQAQRFLENLHGWPANLWKQTSYNTHAGVHVLGGTPLRKNFAGVGMIYDSVKDAFHGKQPYPSWTLNDITALWEAPVTPPTYEEGSYFNWNEGTQSWDKETPPE